MKLTLFLMSFLMILTGCGAPAAEKATYRQVTAAEAMEIMEQNSDFRIVDVRTQEEFASGHIPNAICIPNEQIGTERPAELPDLEETILVYCRSGNRSKQAAEKLAKLGYTNVIEFGGIRSWPGEIVTQ